MPTVRVALFALFALLAAAACGDAGGVATTGSEAAPVTTTVATVAPAPTAVITTTSAAPAADEEEQVAQDGDRVAVNYVGTLDDGTEFDSSVGRAPLEFVVGSGQVISGFDDAVRGLAVGESRTVRIEPAEAYGEIDPQLIVDVPLAQAPAGLEVGDQVQFQTGGTGVVVEVTDEVVRIDANHPLAGQALTFAVDLVSIDRPG